jgi:hypothetical protein
MAGYTKPELAFQANFKPRSIDWPRKNLRDFAVLDQDMLSRDNSVLLGDGDDSYGPLVDGEWVTFDSAGKLVRALDTDGGDGDKHYCETPCYVVVAGAGRTDTMNTKMATVYFGEPGIEFETKLFDWTVDLVPGDLLTVGSVSFDGGTTYKAALKLATGEETPPSICAVVANPNQTGSGLLRVKYIGGVA